MPETLSKPMFSNRALVALTVPIVLDSLLAIIAGIIDSIMVSSVGEAGVSAVSLADSVNVLLVLTFKALTVGGGVVLSQYIGSGDMEKARSAANQLIYNAVTVSVLVSSVVFFFVPQILRFVYGNIENEVYQKAITYSLWTLPGLPFYAIGNACSTILRAQAKSSTALFLTGAINVLNVFGNATLIHVFKLGVAGVAISTSAVRVIWAVISIALLHSKNLKLHFVGLFKIRFNFDILRRILKIGVANGLEDALMLGGNLITTTLISTFGTIAIAAHSAARSLSNIGWTILNSFGIVLLTVVGQCMGAGEYEQARSYTKRFINMALLSSVILFGIIFLLRNYMIQAFSFGEDTLSLAAKLLGISAISTVTSFYSWAIVPSSAFRAAGDVKYTSALSIGSMFVFRIGFAYLLAYTTELGIISVWVGMWADQLFRTICNSIHFRRGKWLAKKVI